MSCKLDAARLARKKRSDTNSDPMREIAMQIYAIGWRDAMKHLRKLALETSYNRTLFAPDDVTLKKDVAE